MDHEHRSDRFTAVEDQYAGYTVVDESGTKIGKVDDLFLDENDQPEYFGVKMGFLGTSSTLIPADITTVNNEQGFIEVSQPKSTVQDGPAFDDDREITPEYENEVRSYYGSAPSRAPAPTRSAAAPAPARPIPLRPARLAGMRRATPRHARTTTAQPGA